MRYLRLLGVLGICLVSASYANAQRVVVGIGVGGPVYVGLPPVCAYGYYNYYPYACAPYGYYGPDWFYGGVFIGAGPWFHGFRGRREFFERRGFRRDFDRDFDDRGRHFEGRGGFVHGGGVGRGSVGRDFRGGRDFHGGGDFRGGNNFRGGGSSRGRSGSHDGGRGRR